jgi:hypothetical protein
MHLRKLAALSCLVLLSATLSARATTVVMRPVWQRVVHADAIVVGKVTEIETKTVTAALVPAFKNQKVELVVAVVKVDDTLFGTDKTTIRVAFPKPMPGLNRIPGLPETKLEVGQEVCLFLTKHYEEPFFVLAGFDAFLDKKHPNFAKDMETVRKASKLLADPKASLESKDATERYETAVMLLTRYTGFGTFTPFGAKTEPIPAEESKRILLGLTEGDWTKADPIFGPMSPAGPLFLQLPNKTGFKVPPGGPAGPASGALEREAKKWLRDNAESYRIQRLVTEK